LGKEGKREKSLFGWQMVVTGREGKEEKRNNIFPILGGGRRNLAAFLEGEAKGRGVGWGVPLHKSPINRKRSDSSLQKGKKKKKKGGGKRKRKNSPPKKRALTLEGIEKQQQRKRGGKGRKRKIGCALLESLSQKGGKRKGGVKDSIQSSAGKEGKKLFDCWLILQGGREKKTRTAQSGGEGGEKKKGEKRKPFLKSPPFHDIANDQKGRGGKKAERRRWQVAARKKKKGKRGRGGGGGGKSLI